MNSKKKLVVSLSVAAAVLVAAVIAIVAVFALGVQTVTSNVKISYTAQEVDGSISAFYKVANAESPVEMGTASFTAGVDAVTGNLNQATTPIALTVKDDHVVFTFQITNNGQKPMSVAASQVKLAPNTKAEYRIVNNDEEFGASLNTVVIKGRETTSTTAVTAVIEVKVSVENKAFDIEEFDMSFEWTMTATAAGTTATVTENV